MKISKRTAIGVLLVVAAYVFVPSMGANLNGIDKYFDNVVWNDWRTVTVAAGNREPGETFNVRSPGLGFNVITVGGLMIGIHLIGQTTQCGLIHAM